jgi:hypothetical protein
MNTTRFGVEREYDAAGGLVGAHHLHHTDRERHLEVIEAIVDPVRDRAIGEDRCEAPPARLDDSPHTANVEEAFMLAGETCGRQILSSRGAANRNRDIGAIFLFELAIGRCDRFSQSRCAGRRIDDLACLGGGFAQQIDLAFIEHVKQAMQLIQCLRAGECVAIGLRRQGEAVWHLDVAFRKGAIEFAQGCRLAAHDTNVAEPNIPEPPDVGIRFRFLPHRNRLRL